MEPVTQGAKASASQINTCLEAIESTGSSILTSLYDFQELTMVQYQNRRSYINSKKVLANRVPGPGTPINISAGDFAYIDQGLTTCSLRGDSGSCTTKETAVTFQHSTSASFTASTGQVNNLDTTGELFQVISDTIPTGTFNITIPSPIACNLVVFDMLASPGSPTISVSVSPDNINFTPFTNISINGSTVTACGPQTDTNYVQVVITPDNPDLLNGISYSFGITALTVRGSSFALRSQFCSVPITFSPISANLYFGTQDTVGVTYYISTVSTPTTVTSPVTAFVQYPPNSIIPITGASYISNLGLSLTAIGGSTNGLITVTLPTNLYLPSLRVTETISGVEYYKRIAPALSVSDTNISYIANEYIVVSGMEVILITSASLTSRIFNVYYSCGPSSIDLTMTAILDSPNTGSSPIFRQAYFEAA